MPFAPPDENISAVASVAESVLHPSGEDRFHGHGESHSAHFQAGAKNARTNTKPTGTGTSDPLSKLLNPTVKP